MMLNDRIYEQRTDDANDLQDDQHWILNHRYQMQKVREQQI